MININRNIGIMKYDLDAYYEVVTINLDTFNFEENFELLRNIKTKIMKVTYKQHLVQLLDIINDDILLIVNKFNITEFNEEDIKDIEEIHYHKMEENTNTYNFYNKEIIYKVLYKNKLFTIKKLKH